MLPKRAPQRQAYRMMELKRWRDHLGVKPLYWLQRGGLWMVDWRGQWTPQSGVVSGQA